MIGRNLPRDWGSRERFALGESRGIQLLIAVRYGLSGVAGSVAAGELVRLQLGF
jgi:hypothetical protein